MSLHWQCGPPAIQRPSKVQNPGSRARKQVIKCQHLPQKYFKRLQDKCAAYIFWRNKYSVHKNIRKIKFNVIKMEEFNVMKHWYDKGDDSPSKKPVKKEPNWTLRIHGRLQNSEQPFFSLTLLLCQSNWGVFFFFLERGRLDCVAERLNAAATVIRHLKMGSLSSSRRRCRPPDWSWRFQTGQIWLRPINPVTKFPAVFLNDDFCPGKINLCLHSHRH